ncbi:MAG: 1-acyl-sn-glycerol-3-phosphate acyltransferase [Cyclobacteriaceae bacterium]
MRRLFLTVFYGLCVRPILKYFIGVSFDHSDVFEREDQFIIVANHNSHFDTIAMMSALPSRHLANTFPVANVEYFGNTPLRSWATRFFVNTIMIAAHHTAGKPSAIDLLDRYLKAGKSIMIFPEGTRGKPGVIADFKTGIAVLLKKNPTIPFVPVYLDGFGRVLPKHSNLIIPLNCRVRFGDPMFAQHESIEELTEKVRKEILELKSKDERDLNRFAYHD